LAARRVTDRVKIPLGSGNDFAANGPDGIDKKRFEKAFLGEQQKSNRKYLKP
jgi:hypothetical protein